MEFTWLSRWQSQILAIWRIVVGLLFLEHGLSKFFVFLYLAAAGPGVWSIDAARMKSRLGGVGRR